ncbi:hypothetical protein HMPREF9597_00376 [Cutibacterium acnes HL005PA4]|nr:hypothetical protein HMPREF9612_00121 [Cutibacterium acnes HL063PA2]EFS80404.1 hypothetical protein HMPREF9597_00376 [Cutibacterium acnes HL005PA4]
MLTSPSCPLRQGAPKRHNCHPSGGELNRHEIHRRKDVTRVW